MSVEARIHLPATEEEARDLGLGRVTISEYVAAKTDEFFPHPNLGFAKYETVSGIFNVIAVGVNMKEVATRNPNIGSIFQSTCEYFGLSGFGELHGQFLSEYNRYRRQNNDLQQKGSLKRYTRLVSESLFRKHLRVGLVEVDS